MYCGFLPRMSTTLPTDKPQRFFLGTTAMIGSTLNMKRTTICSVALAALALTVSFASQSLAQNTWTLRLSEKEGELANGSDPMWSKWLMWDIGYQRMVERNSPYLEVTNASTSTLPITQFHITIGDNRYKFAPVV